MVFLLFCVLFVGCGVITHQKHTAIVTLCKKESIAESKGHSYRIYGTTKTYEMADSHWPSTWRTATGDDYGKLTVPATYKITYIGFRIPLFSNFQNILKYTRVKDNKAEIKKCAGYS